MRIINDTSISSEKYSTVVCYEDMTNPNYIAKLSELSNSLHKQGLDLHEVCLIMRFKMELKTNLQEIAISYQVYNTMPKLNELVPRLYERFDLDCESSIDIKFNDFGDFGDSTKRCISIENFDFFMENEFLASLENDSNPDTRLMYDNLIV
ncbi:conserved hypothetical protein [Candida dubliniensis CD36]|uniref:Uncharacterized protein n=1 Tax=Candida dubliniensis (strain CD36 / ATCC MYA-646 / CBS 7987 / NCPF 3949 / NRRL Y-17841) TaxID=573826 RepID=B9WCK3_CANDC|nr:conserved hypothetical protein [Candida dubliniensis CD36]CAX44126.1 conserved hypothetical protein [Candida dubliniensis CD36]